MIDEVFANLGSESVGREAHVHTFAGRREIKSAIL